ncbi:dol-P-Man:Man(5)GlcNAc(2)-PP-Dol alpha-1,3-mannosyltransferase [Hydra vulgaris]|uniref:dol-P-Man:Man(5)GlcNAc(2)-PP-Dol alpha-1,3-mannosyltransferase n=1 Tax=Hydra vulgaris TaxID=6087 RepID=UPI001F5F094D|nr:dol-P-Man:Man(5)GlcNAc(2)-PP-Dol alpha-1,3-mannosyltransferase [Hydra vulgaris]
MAPIKKQGSILTACLNFINLQKILKLAENVLYNPNYLWVTALLLFIAEIPVNIFVIWKINYTEIDWEAYMKEVEGFLNGTYDYSKLEGGTGPLVYPAGFVYVYSFLYFLTSQGQNIRLAQYIFTAFYLLTLVLVFYIYQKTKSIPPYVAFFICCASYRIHSIYVLRLFNDPLAMIFLYFSVVLYLNDYWSLGCLFYSCGVSIKMNILLFAPGLFVLLLVRHGIKGSIKNISICAFVQVVLGLPFLKENASSYVLRSFDIGRQFFFVWTVNWRFLPENIFLSRWFHFILLFLHMLVLMLFILKKWPKPNNSWLSMLSKSYKGRILSSNEVVFVLFSSNFVGMCFARSLHYQFYVWYFHTLPFLLWSIKSTPAFKLLILGLIEMCWNTYPSTSLSSGVLHSCHFLILSGLLIKNINFERKHE